jgi:tetratricopeptide (TPR) repeat protein
MGWGGKKGYMKSDRCCVIFQVVVWHALLLMLSGGYPTYSQNRVPAPGDKALYEILNLRTQTARAIISSGKKEDPGNLYYEYLENWLEVMELALYEQDDRYDRYVQSFEDRIRRVQSRTDQSSPSYHILLGEMYAHAGMAHILYGDYLDGFRKILSADKNVKQNLREHPGFWMNNKMSGTMNVAFDMMPPVLKWFAGAFGLKGSSRAGFRQLDQYLQSVRDQPGLKAEVLLYYAFVLKMSKRDQDAMAVLQAGVDPDHSPAIDIFMFSNMLFVNGRNEDALSVLSRFPKDKIEIPFRHVDYLEGRAKMNRLDPDAYVPFQRFLKASNFKNNKRDVCMKLAYFYYIQDNMDKYRYYKKLLNTYPKAKMDRDREADVENARPYNPHLQLLRMRFLIAGGYFGRAWEIARSINPNTLVIPAYQSEFYLLTSKIQLNDGLFDACIETCNKAIAAGRGEKEHYAAEAALVAGMAAQKRNKPEEAITYWKTALKMEGDNDVYVEAIHKIARHKLDAIRK